jgi:Tol biopolymer transport system component
MAGYRRIDPARASTLHRRNRERTGQGGRRSLGKARARTRGGNAITFSPVWSPTGTKIAFIGQVDVRGEALPEWEIFTVGVDGTNLIRLTKTKAEEFDPEWGMKP